MYAKSVLVCKQAIVCGKVGQAPVQKILRNGRTVTIFTVGTGGMYDQRIVGGTQLPRPAQWHRIAVHNEFLGAYSVQQLMKEYCLYATELLIVINVYFSIKENQYFSFHLFSACS